MRRKTSSSIGGGRLSLKRNRTANQSSNEPPHPSSDAPASTERVEGKRERERERCRGCVGLANLGETCFISAAAQALYHCPSFRSALVERPHHLLSPLFDSMKASSDALDMVHEEQHEQQQHGQHEEDGGREIPLQPRRGGVLDGAISPDDLVAAVRVLQQGRYRNDDADAEALFFIAPSNA